jgi:hypothetical protein
VNADDPLVQAQLQQIEADYRSQLTQAFGEPLALKIQHFNETQPLRQAMATLAAQLFYSEAPLNPQQAEQLVEILWVNTRDAQGRISQLTTSQNADVIVAQAKNVLSPPQVEAFARSLRH